MRTPEGRDGVFGVVVAPPIGVQVHLAGIGVAVHDHHVLPLLVVVLRGRLPLHSILPGHWVQTHPRPAESPDPWLILTVP